ncbi:MAG: hypothetical protein JSW72_04910 [Candidatus Bathyarchaeota archaeon]|nr:MAG: hypothetical protein JSW72_04910 [Candidatus Bathyarchaeota archaeon]
MPRVDAASLYLMISLFALILVAALVNFAPPRPDAIPWRRSAVGLAFGLVCVLGVLAGVFPSKCAGLLHFQRKKSGESHHESQILSQANVAFRGHHPDCGSFNGHVVSVRQQHLCAGCAGLILGALLSLVGVALHFLINVVLWSNNVLIFWIGFVGVFCGLLQYSLFNWAKSSVHLAVNTYFVVGVFLILVGADGITKSTMVDSYVIILSLLWLYTRILLSQQEHKEICAACHVEKCEFHRKQPTTSSYT